MSPILEISKPDPIIHIKAYGGLKISGEARDNISGIIDAPDLVTLIEEDGQVYITANASCQLTVPIGSSIRIEKAVGSVSIDHIEGPIVIEKVLGNLVLLKIASAKIEKVGGNFSLRNVSESVKIEKVGGHLVVDGVSSIRCEKVGGNCTARNLEGDFSIEKVGGNLLVQNVRGNLNADRVGGSITGQLISINNDLRAGGDIHINGLAFGNNSLALRAGGDVTLTLYPDFEGAVFTLKAGGENIQIHRGEEDLHLNVTDYEYRFGNSDRKMAVVAGGQISLGEGQEPMEDIVDDISSHFEYKESAFGELIQERVGEAMRKADAKIKAAEFRLDQIREEIEDKRGFPSVVEIDPEASDIVKTYQNQATPPETWPIGEKGASDEERLMILQMLQDKQITVDEAETLFRALEE